MGINLAPFCSSLQPILSQPILPGRQRILTRHFYYAILKLTEKSLTSAINMKDEQERKMGTLIVPDGFFRIPNRDPTCTSLKRKITASKEHFRAHLADTQG